MASSEHVRELDAALRAAADPARAEHERSYLKSELAHYGVRVPVVRALAVGTARGLGRAGLLADVVELWDRPSSPVHERRVAAAELLAARTDLLGTEDAALLERLIREARTWALVDVLAPHVVGPLLERDPAAWKPVLDTWARDGDFWLRRAVLLAHLVPLRQGRGDFEQFCAYAEPMLGDPEFFVAKAIGWVLRDTGRKRPELVAAWVLPRASLFRPVAAREVVKVLEPADRARFLAARAAP